MDQMRQMSQAACRPALKVCPHCGELLFGDMDVCYGCLHDFRDGASASRDLGLSSAQEGIMRHNPLAAIELDEVEFDEEESARAPVDPVAPSDAPPAHEVSDQDERQPRHRKVPASTDDTLDLGRHRLEEGQCLQEAPDPPPLDVVIMGKEMEVRVPLVAAGLAVGRGEDNDIILRSRLVSRHHLRMLPIEGGAAIEDCGATNPSELRGSVLEGTQTMYPGDELRVCETVLTLAIPA